VVACAERNAGTVEGQQRIYDLLQRADRACGEYPKHQQRTVWGWFIEGRFGQ